LWLTRQALRKGTNYRSRFGSGLAGFCQLTLLACDEPQDGSVMRRMTRRDLAHLYGVIFVAASTDLRVAPAIERLPARLLRMRSTSREILLKKTYQDQTDVDRGHGDPGYRFICERTPACGGGTADKPLPSAWCRHGAGATGKPAAIDKS